MNCMNIRRILGRDVGNLHDIILTDNYVAVDGTKRYLASRYWSSM